MLAIRIGFTRITSLLLADYIPFSVLIRDGVAAVFLALALIPLQRCSRIYPFSTLIIKERITVDFGITFAAYLILTPYMKFSS